MDETVSQEPTAEESKQLQDAIRQSLLQIQQLRERMKIDQEDIEQSRARTEAMLARLMVR
jgi:hypothetical protein